MTAYRNDSQVYVGGLSPVTTVETFHKYFSIFGPVFQAKIIKNPETNQSRGYGFITFKEVGIVPRVLAIGKHILEGRRLVVNPVKPRILNKVRKIFVGGISQKTSEEDLRAYMSQFGMIEDARILMDTATKRHRGFGFVTFDSNESVDYVCAIRYHTIKGKMVECKISVPRDPKFIVLTNRNLPPAADFTFPQQSFPSLQNELATTMRDITMSTAVTTSYSQRLMSSNSNYQYIGQPLSYRYTPYPYPLPTSSATGLDPYMGLDTDAYWAPTYPLPSIDFASFQNMDWSAFFNAISNMTY